MFPVFVNDGQHEVPDSDIYYIVAKEGLFLKKRVGVMESIAPVSNISILDSVESDAKLHISKMPASKFAKIVEFFRAVYKKYYAESIVLLFYDEERKRHHVVPPYQKVTSGSLDYNRGISIDGMTMIGTIHSHGRMSAFHSGVDDSDEETFDGLHITIGDVDEEEFSVSASIVVNGHRFMVDPCDYVQRLELVRDIDEKVTKSTITFYRFKDGKLVKDEQEARKRGGYTYRKYDKRYQINVSKKYKKVDEAWLNNVEKGTYRPAVSYGYGYGMYGNSNWGNNYDPSFWNEKYRTTPTRVPKSASFTGKDRPAEFPGQKIKDVETEEFNPCFDCIHRDIKIMWALEQYTEEEGNEPEDLIDNFVHISKEENNKIDSTVICGFCGITYSTLKDDLECPSCGAMDPMSADYETAEEPIKCSTCGNRFYMSLDDVCPFCRNPLVEESYVEDTSLVTRIPEPDKQNVLPLTLKKGE